MRVRFIPELIERPASYVLWRDCPLCGGSSKDLVTLTRKAYRFGLSLIPLPAGGVTLRECVNCGMAFKSAVPDVGSLVEILAAEAVNEWRSKAGPHPALPRLRSIADIEGVEGVLDIGASNGDLLRGLAPFCDRLSAYDAVSYPACESVVTGEYILASFEEDPKWSEDAYDLVTAFDVFEHFLEPRRAISNIRNFLKPDGFLVIETGNWRAARPTLQEWYYCNLFEHQIFWSTSSLEYLCRQFGFDMHTCDVVNHKQRLNMPASKQLAISAYKSTEILGFSRRLVTALFGIDPRLLPPSRLEDHLFVVLRRNSVST